jgi:hypothetical protein
MAHKAHVKEAMFATNRKDWEVQIMTVHARQEASVHYTQQLAGKFLINSCILLFLTSISISR